MREYEGILFIGDPHLASHVPGFRKDHYPTVVLAKLGWCLEYARERRLLPAVLGDLFHQPRDNSNWLLGELLALFGRQPVIGLYGNHDCRRNELDENDSLSVIVKAGLLQLVDEEHPWRGEIGGRQVVIGGTPWGKKIPEAYAADAGCAVIWMIHHDVIMPGVLDFEVAGKFEPFEIAGVDLVVNGHIHRRHADVRAGRTMWVTPGNIARLKRDTETREHVPAVLQMTWASGEWKRTMVRVPHEGFADVFHAEAASEAAKVSSASAFVQGLAELQARRTESGAGLQYFIEANQATLEQDVRREVWELFREVEAHEHAANG